MTSSRRSRTKKNRAKYVIWHPDNRWGDFEFCYTTQENYCNCVEDAEHELATKDFDYEEEPGVFGYNRHPREYHIYEISLKRITRGPR